MSVQGRCRQQSLNTSDGSEWLLSRLPIAMIFCFPETCCSALCSSGLCRVGKAQESSRLAVQMLAAGRWAQVEGGVPLCCNRARPLCDAHPTVPTLAARPLCWHLVSDLCGKGLFAYYNDQCVSLGNIFFILFMAVLSRQWQFSIVLRYTQLE